MFLFLRVDKSCLYERADGSVKSVDESKLLTEGQKRKREADSPRPATLSDTDNDDVDDDDGDDDGGDAHDVFKRLKTLMAPINTVIDLT